MGFEAPPIFEPPALLRDNWKRRRAVWSGAPEQPTLVAGDVCPSLRPEHKAARNHNSASRASTTSAARVKKRRQRLPQLRAPSWAALLGRGWQRRSFRLRNSRRSLDLVRSRTRRHTTPLQQAPLKGVRHAGSHWPAVERHTRAQPDVFAVYSTRRRRPRPPSAAPLDDAAMLAPTTRRRPPTSVEPPRGSRGAGMLLRVGETRRGNPTMRVLRGPGEVSRHPRAATTEGSVPRVGGALERVGPRVGDELTALDGQPRSRT